MVYIGKLRVYQVAKIGFLSLQAFDLFQFIHVQSFLDLFVPLVFPNLRFLEISYCFLQVIVILFFKATQIVNLWHAIDHKIVNMILYCLSELLVRLLHLPYAILVDLDDKHTHACVVDCTAKPILTRQHAVDSDDRTLAQHVQCLVVVIPIGKHDINYALHYNEDRIGQVTHIEEHFVLIVKSLFGVVVQLANNIGVKALHVFNISR